MANQLKAEQIEKSLPALIRERRKQLNMTLQELAEQTGLSTASLSQAERGKSTPSLVSTIKLARALKVDMDYFLKPPSPDSLVSRGDALVPMEIDAEMTYYRLDGAVKNKKMTIILIDMPPGSYSPPVPRDDLEEFMYVLGGSLHLEIGDEEFDLGVGDSVHLNTQSGRAGGNVSEESTRILWIGTPPIFDES